MARYIFAVELRSAIIASAAKRSRGHSLRPLDRRVASLLVMTVCALSGASGRQLGGLKPDLGAEVRMLGVEAERHQIGARANAPPSRLFIERSKKPGIDRDIDALLFAGQEAEPGKAGKPHRDHGIGRV